MFRDLEKRVAYQDEGQPSRRFPKVRAEKVKKLLAPLVRVDAAHVNRKRAADVELLPESRRLWVSRHFGAHAHHNARHILIRGDRMNHRALFRRVVHQSADASEKRLEDRQANRRIAFGRGNQNRARRDGSHSVIRMVVPIAEEDEEVVVLRVRRHIVDESGTRGTFGVEPVEFVAQRVHLTEDAFRQPPERDRVALVLDAESAHHKVIDPLDTFWQLVLPRHVVDGARREDFDLGMPAKTLRNIPGVQLGTTVDGVTVPLDDESELHRSSSLPSESPGSDSSIASASRSGASWCCWASWIAWSAACVMTGSCPASMESDTDWPGPGPPAELPIIAVADPPPRRPRRRRRRRLRCPGPSCGPLTAGRLEGPLLSIEVCGMPVDWRAAPDGVAGLSRCGGA